MREGICDLRSSFPACPKGEDSGTGGGRARRTVPVDFPNCHYSFANPPPFIGDLRGPTFSLRHPESTTAFTYFSLLFDDDLLNHIANQTICTLDCVPFIRLTINRPTLMSMNIGHFWG